MAEKSFEQSLKRLEVIAGELENGDIPLDKSLKLFEEGVKLTRLCSEKLKQAEGKVEMLIQAQDGEITSQPFKIAEDDANVDENEADSEAPELF